MIHLNLTAEYTEDEDLDPTGGHLAPGRVVIILNGTPALFLKPVRAPSVRYPNDEDEVVLETVLDALKAIPGGGWSASG